MTRFLASVASLDEARIALAGGADIVDLKDPSAGALGALPVGTVRAIVEAIGGACPLSATVGDLPLDPEVLAGAAVAMADTGVDFVKLGFFGASIPRECLDALVSVARHRRLVAVLFADLDPAPRDAVAALAGAGFAGVMLDTAGKGGGSLTAHLPSARLADFVGEAHRHGLFCGLAGSLRAGDIHVLLPLAPDYLGFRSALCAGGDRTASLDDAAVRAIRRRIPQATVAVA